LKSQDLTYLPADTLVDLVYPLPGGGRAATDVWPLFILETNVPHGVTFETDLNLDYDVSAASVTLVSKMEWHARESSFDLWLSDTLGIISRELEGAENEGLKCASEALAYYFAAVDFQRRPQLMVGRRGHS
jgi:hypothetical protein